MECCICYQTTSPNTYFYITECNHTLCLVCLKKIDQIKCPYCRQPLKNIPKELKNKGSKSPYLVKLDYELNNLSYSTINILLKIKQISELKYNMIVDNITNGVDYVV